MSEDKHIPIDYRIMRPCNIISKKQGTNMLMNVIDTIKLKNKNITFLRPNVVTLYLNVSNKNYNLAIKSYDNFIKPKFKENKIEFNKNELNKLYDYFEYLQTSIITGYGTVEAFTNLSIPADFIYETVDPRTQAKILWNKHSIERWIITSEKLKEILPKVLKVEPPQNQKFWSYFKELEKVRNEIIHPKSNLSNPQLNIKYFEFFFDAKVFKWIRSIKDVIQHYCMGIILPHFPFGIGKDGFVEMEIDDFDEYFEEIND